MHIRRRASSEKVFTRWCKDINDLGLLGKETFVLDVAGNYCNIARDHRLPIVPDAKIHPTFEHPNNLLVWVLVRSGMCTGFHLPPHDHALFTGKHTPLNFIGDALPRQSSKCAKTRQLGLDATS